VVRIIARALVPALVIAGLAGCAGSDEQDIDLGNQDKQDKDLKRYGSVFGGDDTGLVLFGGDDDESNGSSGFGPGLAINPFLWRAALETTDFMPLIQTDPVGGVIISDWYSPPETPDERFKLTVYVLDRALRSDAVQVSVFKQRRDEAGNWVDAPVDPSTARRIEDNILSLARELRVASLEQS
jgi:hypothetical protein